MSISCQPTPASVLAGLAPDEQLQKIDEAFSSPPWWYHLRALGILTFTYRSTLWTQVRHFAGNVADRHLEVAVGTGTLLGLVLGWRRLAGAPRARVVGLDCAEAMLAGARRRFRKNPDVELVKGDAAATELPEDSFASANVPNAMHCFPRVDAVLAEIFRVLAPGGTLAANVLLHPRGIAPLRWIANRINAWAMRKGILHTPYALEDIRGRFRAAGFEIVRERVSGNTWMVDARKPESPGTRGERPVKVRGCRRRRLTEVLRRLEEFVESPQTDYRSDAAGGSGASAGSWTKPACGAASSRSARS